MEDENQAALGRVLAYANTLPDMEIMQWNRVVMDAMSSLKENTNTNIADRLELIGAAEHMLLKNPMPGSVPSKQLHITLISLDRRVGYVAQSMYGYIPFAKGMLVTRSALTYLTCDLKTALDHNSYDYIVTPGNSFGHMTGGFDRALVELYGPELDVAVRRQINGAYLGEANVGQAFVVRRPRGTLPEVVYAPTMRTPKRLPGNSEACYLATLAAMQTIATEERNSGRNRAVRVLLPLMGHGTGDMPLKAIANQTAMAISRLIYPTECRQLFEDGVEWDKAVTDPSKLKYLWQILVSEMP